MNELRLMLDLDAAQIEDSPRDRVIGRSGHRVIDSAVNSMTRSPDAPMTRFIRLPLPMLDSRLFLKLLQLELRAHRRRR